MSERRRDLVVFILSVLAAGLAGVELVRLDGVTEPRVVLALVTAGWVALAVHTGRELRRACCR